MKTRRLSLPVVGFLAATVLGTSFAYAQPVSAPGAILIASRTVTGADADDSITIPAPYGNLASIDLIVRAQNPVMFPTAPLFVSTVRIVFSSGDPQEVAVNALLPMDPEAPLQIPVAGAGPDRLVTQIVLRYDHAGQALGATAPNLAGLNNVAALQATPVPGSGGNAYVWVYGNRN